MTDSSCTLISGSVEQTVAFGRRLAKFARPGMVIALVGQLGAGKTQLVRGLVGGLGGDESIVSSPTFVLMQQYPTTPMLIHIDAYRMNSMEDLESIGWSQELLDDAVTVIEWADRIADELPNNTLFVRLNHAGEMQREISIETPAGLNDEYAALLTSASSIVSCPACGNDVAEEEATFPFCSERCRLVDLNKWFNGEYHISRPAEEEDFNL